MVLKWDVNKRYCCHGQVKFRGIDTGAGKWKMGQVVIHQVNGKWKIELFTDTSPNAVISTVVSSASIKQVICKAQLVITLVAKGTETSIHYRPEPYNQMTAKPMHVLDDLIKDICSGKLAQSSSQNASEVCVTGWQHNSLTTPSKNGAIKDNLFTRSFIDFSVKKKNQTEEVGLFEDTDDENEFKENQNRGQVMSKEKSNRFLQNGMEKARSHLQQIETSGFYGSSAATPRTYGAFSTTSNLKRTPGLMPDPNLHKRPRLSDPINYTWNKSSISTQTNNQQQIQAKSLQGFSNLGNTCYMNAILQSLFCLDTFSNDLLFSNVRVMKSLQTQSLYSALYRLLKSRSRTLPEHVRREMLRNVKAAISTTAKRFSGYQQHDAHEFLGQVLDQLKEEVTKVSGSTPSPQREGSDSESQSTQFVNPIGQNFEMEVVHSITCLNCQEVVTKEEQFNDLSLDMPRCRRNGEMCSIQNALDLFFRSETIEYTCEKCGSNKSEVSHKFTRLPRVLVLHLKRYSFDQAVTIHTKKAQNIRITRFLTLQSHCEEETYPPFPVVLHSSEDYKTPDKSAAQDDNVPRRKLQLTESYSFKKSKILPDMDVGDNTKEEINTTTPYKKPKIFDLEEDHEIKADIPLTIEDTTDEEDKDLARALELSLQEANDRSQHYVDETKESELQKVLEMSRVEMEKASNMDHDYGKNLQNMSEEEQLRLAIEQSLLESSGLHHNNIEDEHTHTIKENGHSTDKVEIDNHTHGHSTPCESKIGRKELIQSAGRLEQKSPLCTRKSNTAQGFNKIKPVNEKQSDIKLEMISEETEVVFSDSHQECSSVGQHHERLTTSTPAALGKEAKHYSSSVEELESSSKPDGSETKSTRTCLFGKLETSNACDTFSKVIDGGTDKSNLVSSVADSSKEGNHSVSKQLQTDDVVDLPGTDDRSSHAQEGDNGTGDTDKSNKVVEEEDYSSLLCDDEEDFQLMLMEDKENAFPNDTAADVRKDSNIVPPEETYPDLPVVDNEKGDLPYSYKLVSIVNHVGNTSAAGHYVTDVFDMKKGSWFSCDDSHVTKATESEVHAKRERSGYIFFYLSKEIFEDLKDNYAIIQNRKRKS